MQKRSLLLTPLLIANLTSLSSCNGKNPDKTEDDSIATPTPSGSSSQKTMTTDAPEAPSDSDIKESPANVGSPSTPPTTGIFTAFIGTYQKISEKKVEVGPRDDGTVEFCNTEPTVDSDLWFPQFARYAEFDAAGSKLLARFKCTSATECETRPYLGGIDTFSNISGNTLTQNIFSSSYSLSECYVQKAEVTFTLDDVNGLQTTVTKSLKVSPVTESECTQALAKQKSAEIVNCRMILKVGLKKLN